MTIGTSSVQAAKLRFPEFVGQKFHDVRLGEVTAESRDRNGSKHPPASVMGVRKEDGIVPMEERLVATDISRYKLVRRNWFAYNPMRLNIGSIARWQGNSIVLVSPDYVVFRCLDQSAPAALDPEYLDHFRKSNQWDAFVNEAGDGGVRVRIYYRDVSQLRLIVPEVAEQQKIAVCLGSLDDLIKAEARKLEALRQHKQGLMQQLFPQPGETVPRLRFPEFRGAREWDRKRLGDVLKVGYGRDYRHLAKGDVPVYGTGGYMVSVDTHLYDGESVCIGRKGTIDSPMLLKGRFWTTDTLFYTHSFGDCLPRFMYLVFQRVPWQNHNSASGVPSLSKTTIEEIVAGLPELAEQSKIADCFGSLDDLIASQDQRLEALRQHKQGMMQQLFPSLESY